PEDRTTGGRQPHPVTPSGQPAPIALNVLNRNFRKVDNMSRKQRKYEKEIRARKAAEAKVEAEEKAKAERKEAAQQRAKAEEQRRAALTPEERAAEDKRNGIIGLIGVAIVV